MADDQTIPPDMQRALEIVGDPKRLLEMLDVLAQTMDFLHDHGWAKFGVVMLKDGHRAMLSLDGEMALQPATSGAEMPPELHQLADFGRRFDA